MCNNSDTWVISISCLSKCTSYTSFLSSGTAERFKISWWVCFISFLSPSFFPSPLSMFKFPTLVEKRLLSPHVLEVAQSSSFWWCGWANAVTFSLLACVCMCVCTVCMCKCVLYFLLLKKANWALPIAAVRLWLLCGYASPHSCVEVPLKVMCNFFPLLDIQCEHRLTP